MTRAYNLILRGGEIVNHAGGGPGDVGVRIARIDSFGAADSETVVDARALMIMPGAFDSQVHFREPGPEWKEDLETDAASAVLDGVTAVFEMPNTEPTTTTEAPLADKRSRAAGRMSCDHAF